MEIENQFLKTKYPKLNEQAPVNSPELVVDGAIAAVQDDKKTQNTLQAAEDAQVFVDLDYDNFNEIAQTEASAELDENATEEDKSKQSFWKALIDTFKNDLNKLFDTLDENADGKLSAEEIGKYSLVDGDSMNLSVDDLKGVFDKLGYEMPSSVLENETATEDEVENTETTSDVENTDGSQLSMPSAAASGARGSGGGGGGSGGSGGANTAPRTPENIQSEIDAKEGKIKSSNTETQAKVTEKQNEINEAMKAEDSGIPPELQQEYETKDAEFATQIADKENEIQNVTSNIQDTKASIAATTSAIASFDGRISDYEGKLSDPDIKDDKKTEIRGAISNLQSEKKIQEGKKADYEKNLSGFETQLSTATDAKAALQTQKDALYDELIMKSDKVDKEKVAATKIKIDALKVEMNDIQTAQQANVESLNSDIQALKIEKTEALQKIETNKTLAENKVVGVVAISDFISKANAAVIAKLHPEMQEKVVEFYTLANADGKTFDLMDGSSIRTLQYQEDLYAQDSHRYGRPNPGATSALHFTGQAIDISAAKGGGSLESLKKYAIQAGLRAATDFRSDHGEPWHFDDGDAVNAKGSKEAALEEYPVIKKKGDTYEEMEFYTIDELQKRGYNI